MVEEAPAEVREAARRAFAERDRSAEIMPLRYDSLLADAPGDRPRHLTFTGRTGPQVAVAVHPVSSGETVEVEITAVGCSLAEVQCGGVTFAVDAPAQTRVGPAPHGLLSVVLTSGEDGSRLRTSWIRV